MTIKLDLRTDLHLVREAFDAGQLQGQDPSQRGGRCHYAGPCAVGVMMPPDVRQALDEDYGPISVSRLLFGGEILLPEEQQEDLIRLQRLHDEMMAEDRPTSPRVFNHLLTELEAKYDHQA